MDALHTLQRRMLGPVSKYSDDALLLEVEVDMVAACHGRVRRRGGGWWLGWLVLLLCCVVGLSSQEKR